MHQQKIKSNPKISNKLKQMSRLIKLLNGVKKALK